jgi:hypothetical protein
MVKKAFFGKSNCLKVQQTDSDVYFHMGVNKAGTWEWTKIKMGDTELGEIIRVLEGKSERWSTVHQFGEKQNKIWVNRSADAVFFKVNDISKSLNSGEQEVMATLLRSCIVKMDQ